MRFSASSFGGALGGRSAAVVDRVEALGVGMERKKDEMKVGIGRNEERCELK